MIISPKRLDRLSTLVAALAPRATICAPSALVAPLLVVTGPLRTPRTVVLRLTPGIEPDALVTVALTLRLPLAEAMRGLPDRTELDLTARPALLALAQVLVAEQDASRCGWAPALAHMAEALLILTLRSVIDSYPPDGPAGLLAGLSHPRLHAALVAMHDAPAHPWTTATLAERAGMSRSNFMQVFADTVGVSPMAYLSAWRLTGARAALQAGAPLRHVSEESGFSSTEAFSRAFRRHHGIPPSHVRPAT